MSDKERLEQFSYRLATLIGAVLGIWFGWIMVASFAVFTAWSAYRYFSPKRVWT